MPATEWAKPVLWPRSIITSPNPAMEWRLSFIPRILMIPGTDCCNILLIWAGCSICVFGVLNTRGGGIILTLKNASAVKCGLSKRPLECRDYRPHVLRGNPSHWTTSLEPLYEMRRMDASHRRRAMPILIICVGGPYSPHFFFFAESNKYQTNTNRQPRCADKASKIPS